MDENDKQKSADNNNASARPGIFSTPDLTIDAEKIAQPTSSPDATKTRVASFFANTDATRQAQQPTIVSQPLEGDIVLNNTAKKRSKLSTVMLVAFGSIILAAIVMTSIFITNKQSNPTAISNESAKVYFDRFANFMLYEETGDVLEGDYRPTYDYSIMRNMGKTPENDRFWSEMLGLFDAAKQTYAQIAGTDEVLLSVLNMYSQNLSFLNDYRQMNMPDSDSLIADYIDSGYEIAMSRVEENFANTYNDENPISLQYYPLVVNEYNAMFRAVELYKIHNCISNNGIIDDICVKNITNIADNDSGVSQILMEYNDAVQQTMLFADSAIKVVVENCWEISSEIGDAS